MSLVFHWFLPTSGDGRGIVGRVTAFRFGSSAGPSAYATEPGRSPRPPDLDIWGRSPVSRAARLHWGAHAHGDLVRGRWPTTAALKPRRSG